MSASPPASDAGSPAPESASVSASGAVQATQAALLNQVFGAEGSDDSDLSDIDDEPRETRRLPFPPRQAEAAERDSGEEDNDVDQDHDRDEDNDDEDRDEDDVYQPGTTTAVAKIPKFKKKKRDAEDEDGDVTGEEAGGDDEDEQRRRKKRKEKKRSRRERVEVVDGEDESAQIVDPAQLKIMSYNDRIDSIGKKAKVMRRKKKGDDDVDIVDSYHDDVCARLRDRMISAAERDRVSNDAKLPATSKLAMLDEVMSVLRNTTLWQSIVDNGVLDAVRQWLEPIAPSGALPAVGIQKAIFEVLPRMDLDTQTLKECRLGPIVLFYSKTKRVTPAINRQADALVQAWSRPIIKRSANYRSRHVETLSEAVESTQRNRDRDEDEDVDEDAIPIEQIAPQKKKRFDVRKALAENKDRKGARLYNSKDIQYSVAPESQLQHHTENLSHVSRIQQDNKKFNRFARQMLKGRGAR